MYITKVFCLLSTFYRYIIVFAIKDNFPVRHTENLNNLKWENIQTRTLPDRHDLITHLFIIHDIKTST